MILDLIQSRRSKKLRDNGIIVKDRPIKSLLKAISWRMLGTCDTIMISWILTGRIKVAVSIGGVEVFSKIFLFYLHERLWNNIRWGRMNVRIRRNVRLFRKTFKSDSIKTKVASIF